MYILDKPERLSKPVIQTENRSVELDISLGLVVFLHKKNYIFSKKITKWSCKMIVNRL